MRASRALLLAALVALLALLCMSVGSASTSGASPSPWSSRFLKQVGVSTGLLRPSADQVLEWLQYGSSGKDDSLPLLDLALPQGELFAALRRRFIQRAEREARTLLGGGDPELYEHPPLQSVGANDYPYWQFIPTFVGGVKPSEPLKWEGSASSCFAQNSAILKPSGGSSNFTLTLSSSQPRTPLCSDFYLIATVDGLAFQTMGPGAEATASIEWSVASGPGAPQSHQWDIQNRGVRVFRFNGDLLTMLVSVIDTALLFEGELTEGISPEAAARNIDFLAKYAGVHMSKRAVTEVELDESEIHSGDFFGIMRLDGMDPMLAWAMGSTTGHTTVALWDHDELFVCESTTKAPHWPVNGVQRTPYRQWLKQVKAAGQMAVHAPLTREARARFNETAALAFLRTNEGFDYGFQTLLWGWLDTVEDNYPCLPPNWEVCLGWDAFEVVFGLMDQFVPDVAQMLFRGAFNNRLGTRGLRASELFHAASIKGIKHGELPTIVEQDHWTYNTTRYGEVAEGKSMVCCVFVCAIWKAAGVFGDMDVQCGELTNWDDYALTILDYPARPAQCVVADPDNDLCQLEGEYTLVLNDYASKKPYARMAQQCPTKPPFYDKPSTC